MATVLPLPVATPIASPVIARRTTIPTPLEAQNVELIGQVALDAAADVAVSGSYAYVADIETGLRIVDISSTTVIGNLPLQDEAHIDRNPGLSSPAVGGMGGAEVVKIQGDYVYVLGGGGLRIIDVTNPVKPIELSQYSVGNVFDVVPGYLYFATDEKICTVDVADPRHPIEVGCVNVDFVMTADIAVAGNYAYVVDGAAFHIVDITNPTAPDLIHTSDLEFAYKVSIAGDYAYVVQDCNRFGNPCGWYNVNLSILDISDPNAPVHVGTYYPGYGYIGDISVNGQYAYLTLAGLSRLQIVDVSNPAAPTLAGYYGTFDWGVGGIATQDNMVYVAGGDAGFLIFHFTETAHSTLVPIEITTPIPGKWYRITTAEGLCTDWPLLIGSGYIGADDHTICYSLAASSGLPWPALTTLIGRPLAASWCCGLITDAGTCDYNGLELRCELSPGEIYAAAWHESTPIYMLGTSVKYAQQTYDIARFTDGNDARPIWLVVSNVESMGAIWVGTNGYGVIVIHLENGEMTQYTTANGLPGNIIHDVTTVPVDHYGYTDVVWIATDQGLVRWDGMQWTTYTTADGLPSNDIRGVSSNRYHTIWAATAGGAAYFNGQTWYAFTPENGLPTGDLNGVQAQPGGEVWFSTRGNGLLVFVPAN